MSQLNFDWADLAFASKQPIKQLKATFIVAPRQLSKARLTEIVKTYLPKGNVVLGLSKQPFVEGFEDQPQFAMLELADVQPLAEKIAKSKLPHKFVTLAYFQAELPHILEKLAYRQVILVNGSWSKSFHTLPAYYDLAKQGIKPEFISPFVNEAEAKAYAKSAQSRIAKTLNLPKPSAKTYSEIELIQIADISARQSFDHTFQTGAVIAKPSGRCYRLQATAFNEIVPYATFAMHNGASREQYLSPPNDLNHYDTVHAEVQGIITALADGQKLTGSSLFVNLLPCPVCARVITKSGITEVVYQHDHSDGYAVRLLQKAGLTVRRLIF